MNQQSKSGLFTCGGCDATWTGANTSHCSGCHRTFSGPSLFDKHRQATERARVWVRYMDSEGEFPEPKVLERFVHPKAKNLSDEARRSAVAKYRSRMKANEANGVEIFGIEYRDVQIPRGRCVDPGTMTRPLSDREIELGAVGFIEKANMVPVFEFYGTTYEAVRDGKTQVRTRAEMWRAYRLRNAAGDIIDMGAWNRSGDE